MLLGFSHLTEADLCSLVHKLRVLQTLWKTEAMRSRYRYGLKRQHAER